jgi:hypothetical protein
MSTKWQAWTIFALGLWLAVSPWIAGYAEHHAATGNAVAMGLILALASHFECVACDEAPVEWLNLAVGLWLIAAPFMLEFTGIAVASVNSIAVGAFAVALAVSALSLDKYFGKLWHRT